MLWMSSRWQWSILHRTQQNFHGRQYLSRSISGHTRDFDQLAGFEVEFKLAAPAIGQGCMLLVVSAVAPTYLVCSTGSDWHFLLLLTLGASGSHVIAPVTLLEEHAQASLCLW